MGFISKIFEFLLDMPIQTETEQTSLLGEPIYDTKPENTSINESGEPIVEGTGNYFSAFFNIL